MRSVCVLVTNQKFYRRRALDASLKTSTSSSRHGEHVNLDLSNSPRMQIKRCVPVSRLESLVKETSFYFILLGEHSSHCIPEFGALNCNWIWHSDWSYAEIRVTKHKVRFWSVDGFQVGLPVWNSQISFSFSRKSLHCFRQSPLLHIKNLLGLANLYFWCKSLPIFRWNGLAKFSRMVSRQKSFPI